MKKKLDNNPDARSGSRLNVGINSKNMIDFRKKIFIAVGIVLALIIALVLFLLYFRQPKAPASNPTTPVVTETGGKVSQSATPATPATGSGPVIAKPAEAAKPAVAPAEFYVKQLSGIFLERFLSYSNQNNNQHLDDVLSLTTDKMAKWVMMQKVQPSSEYQGVNTTVVASSVKEITASQAVVLIGVQRVYEGKENKTEYKNGRVELIKVGQEWKVDGFYWE